MTTLHSLTRIGLALSDPTRLRFLHALAGGELCACQLVELARLAPSTVSRHLALLEQAGLATSRKDGRWVYYRLGPMTPIMRAFLNALSKADDLAGDRKQILRIRGTPLDQICKKQRKS